MGLALACLFAILGEQTRLGAWVYLVGTVVLMLVFVIANATGSENDIIALVEKSIHLVIAGAFFYLTYPTKAKK